MRRLQGGGKSIQWLEKCEVGLHIIMLLIIRFDILIPMVEHLNFRLPTIKVPTGKTKMEHLLETLVQIFGIGLIVVVLVGDYFLQYYWSKVVGQYSRLDLLMQPQQ